MEIAVLGGGNGSYAGAADLAEQGHGVRLWRRDAGAFAPVLDRQSLMLRDASGLREVPLRATLDLGEAVSGAALILAPVPAFGQVALGQALAPHLTDGQVVLMPPGSFGCYVVDRARGEAGSTAHVAFAESGTLPWLTRKHGPHEIVITTRATRLPTGVWPARDSARAFAVLRAAFPSIEPCGDALDGALLNAGPIIHPPLILMNAGPLQHFPAWDIHNEGTQPAIRAVTDALDLERVALREALGIPGPHFPLRDHYATDGDEWMYGRKAHAKLVDSADWRERIDLLAHRYMREDVVIGLAFLVSVADWAGVAAPVARGLLAIASAILGEPLLDTGRTLATLGLGGLDRAGMAALLQNGLAA